MDTNFDVVVFEERIRYPIMQIGNGIQTALISNEDGIICEGPCYSSFGPNHGNDYLLGRGIMMRYIGAKDKKNLRS